MLSELDTKPVTLSIGHEVKALSTDGMLAMAMINHHDASVEILCEATGLDELSVIRGMGRLAYKTNRISGSAASGYSFI